MRLKNRTAIITGGTSGIGLAVAHLFVQEGARVVLMARDKSRGEQAAIQLGGQAIFVAGNVGNAQDCQHCVETAVQTFEQLDILFNNAGIIHVNRTLADTSEEEWDETLNSNLKGTFLMSKYAIPHMAKNGGAIINNASIFGLVGGGWGCSLLCGERWSDQSHSCHGD